MNKQCAVLLYPLLVVYALSAQAANVEEVPSENSRALTIYAVEEPPSSFINAAGEADGFAVDVVREIQARLDNHNPIEFVPEVRALRIAEDSPNVLFFAFSRTPSREDQFHWVTLLTRKSWVLYSRKNAGLHLTDLEQAKSLGSIGVVRGDIRAYHLQDLNFPNLQQVSYHDLNVKMLQRGRIDALYYEPLGMAYACEKLGIPLSEFEAVLKTRVSEVYLLMSKATDAATVERWQQAAAAIKADGTFDKIAQKWSDIIYQQTGITSTVADNALNF